MTPYQTPERIALKFNAIKEPAEFWTDKTVVDIGCAEGMLYPLLKKCSIKKYVGVDTSSEYIHVARTSFPEAEFRQIDLRQLDEPFDIAVSLSTLHILDDIDFEKTIARFSTLFETLIFEVPVKGSSPIYHTRSEKHLENVVTRYFTRLSCHGVSPSPHDPQSLRKVFKCSNG
jgi:cyclopropane fatty-acyl-phospholipid synthase-like methyltransferase